MKAMNYYLWCLFILITLNAESQTVFKLDSLHQFSWDMGTSSWKHNTRDLYTYDNGGTKETNLLRLILNAGNWENFYQFNKIYNGLNDLSENIRQNWTGTTWQNSEKFDHEYNIDDLLQKLSYSIFTSPTWLLFNENLYDYDVLGNQIEDILTEYNFTTMLMENKERRTYSYTLNRITEEILEEWRDVLNDWENDERIQYFYDIDEYLIRTEKSGWNVGSFWSTPFQQFLYTYNVDNQIESATEQLFASGFWNNEARLLSTFTSGNLTELLGQEWNSGSMLWDNSFRQLRTFDPDDNETELIFESWEPIGMVWEGFLRIVNFWSPEDTLGITFVSETNTRIYPNPVIDYLTVEFKDKTNANWEASLYDVNGKRIHNMLIHSGISSFKMPLNQNNSGLYFLHLSNGRNKQVYKIIKD